MRGCRRRTHGRCSGSGISAHADTVTRNAERYPKLAEWYAKKIKSPRLGDEWGYDEKRQKVRGGESRIVAATCAAARFALAWDASAAEEKCDAAPLLRAAKAVACGSPRPSVADGPKQYRVAFKKAHHAAGGPGRRRILDIRLRNAVCNANTRERPNREFADRFGSARSVSREGPPTFRVTMIPHNFIKPHGGMGGRTPAEAACIGIRARGKWPIPMQNAGAAA